MGGFLSFVKKEMLHILRDRRTMLIVLGIPVMPVSYTHLDVYKRQDVFGACFFLVREGC